MTDHVSRGSYDMSIMNYDSWIMFSCAYPCGALGPGTLRPGALGPGALGPGTLGSGP